LAQVLKPNGSGVSAGEMRAPDTDGDSSAGSRAIQTEITGTSCQGKTTFYEVKVSDPNYTHDSWTVKKRYSQFIQLELDFIAKESELTRETLPAKGFMGVQHRWSPKFNQRRQDTLDSYLKSLVLQVSVLRQDETLFAFLQKPMSTDVRELVDSGEASAASRGGIVTRRTAEAEEEEAEEAEEQASAAPRASTASKEDSRVKDIMQVEESATSPTGKEKKGSWFGGGKNKVEEPAAEATADPTSPTGKEKKGSWFGGGKNKVEEPATEEEQAAAQKKAAWEAHKAAMEAPISAWQASRVNETRG